MPVATIPRLQRSITKRPAYSVSEHALLSAIADAFRQTGYGQLRSLAVRREGESVILAGQVPTYFLKQLAQTVAMSVSGVGCVDNEIHVVSDESSPA